MKDQKITLYLQTPLLETTEKPERSPMVLTGDLVALEDSGVILQADWKGSKMKLFIPTHKIDHIVFG